MTDANQLHQTISDELSSLYGAQEAKSISFLLLEHLFAISKTDLLLHKEIDIADRSQLDECITRLKNEEPLQYVLGNAHFYGYEFMVTPSTLIPRPETEELVNLILKENKALENNLSILDIGTGSGCIAITLKKELPLAKVFAIDISEGALAIATKNAEANHAEVHFSNVDILDENAFIPSVHIIVSNPPYVMHKEKALMKNNVLQHEPHLALFIEDNDPLVYYKAITRKAKQSLKPKGKLYFEINEQFGQEVILLLQENGFENCILFKDLYDKDRMVRGIKSE